MDDFAATGNHGHDPGNLARVDTAPRRRRIEPLRATSRNSIINPAHPRKCFFATALPGPAGVARKTSQVRGKPINKRFRSRSQTAPLVLASLFVPSATSRTARPEDGTSPGLPAQALSRPGF